MRVRIPHVPLVTGTRTTKAPEYFRHLFADVLKTQNVVCFRLRLDRDQGTRGGWLCISYSEESYIPGLWFLTLPNGKTQAFDNNHDIFLRKTPKISYGDDLMTLP
jgi:hypothetical protein